MTTHNIRNSRPPGRLLVLTVLAALSLAVTSTAWSKPDKGDENWSEWRGMSRGFVARKRVPPPPKAKKLKKRQQSSRTNLKKGLVKGSSAQALWLKTSAEGLYKLTVTELLAATGQKENRLRRLLKSGRHLVLTNRGLPVRWHYDKASDSIYFVAEAVDTMYTGENAFRLFQKRNAAETMEQVTGVGPEEEGTRTPFVETLKFEEEPDGNYLLWTVKDDPDADYWIWDYLYGGFKDEIDIPFDLPGASAEGQAEVRAALRGWTELVAGNDHSVHFELGASDGSDWVGSPIGKSVQWDGFEAAELVADFDQSDLNGDDTLRLASDYIAGDAHTGQSLDEIHVAYWREPVAENDRLWMHQIGAGQHTVDGFSTNKIMVIESPAGAAKWRSDITIAPADDGSGTYSVTFLAESKAPTDFLVVGSDAVKTPIIEQDSPSRLAKRNNRVDYLIIAPRELAQTAEDLREYRSNYLRRVQIAWYEDIIDEFNHGIEDPKAINAFLAYAKANWKRAPAYVTLVGAGKLDHKNRMGYGDSLLPVRMTTTPWGLAPSDNRHMDVDGDGLMDFAYGRIPVTDDAEGLDYIAKVKAFETSSPISERIVLVADNPDDAGDFHGNSDELAETLETLGYDITKLYHPSTSSVRANLTSTSTWEAALVNYDGHGSPQQIGANNNGEKFLNVEDVAALSNQTLPVFAAMTCATGDDTQPGAPSLAGALTLKPGGGAVASFAPSGLSLDADAQVMSRVFTDALIGERMTIGDAAMEAQHQSAGLVNDFMLRIYQVIGEPFVYVQ